MRKEIIVAIFAGVLVGAAIAFGVWRANSALKSTNVATQKQESPDELTQTEDESETPDGLSLINPDNMDVVTASETSLGGITKPNSVVFVSSEEIDYTTLSENSGEFSQQIDLVGGVNRLIIKSFDDMGNSTQETLTLVYSSQLETNAATESSSLEDKVEDKIQKASQKLKAFMGTLTDITDSTLQLESTQEEIQLVSISEETDIVDVTDEAQNVNQDDLAIGDFLVSMGMIDENSVLNALRILVTTPPEEVQRDIVKGQLIEIYADDSIDMQPEGEEVLNISTNRFTDVFIKDTDALIDSGTADLDVGQEIIVSYVKDEEEIAARNIVIFKLISPTPTPEPEN